MQGDARAHNNLAVHDVRGNGVAREPEASSHWFRRAAEQGLADAQNDLRSLYCKGWGTERDHVAHL